MTAHGNGEESRWGGQSRATICEVYKPVSAFPSVKRRDGKTLLGTELRDTQTAFHLAVDAIAPERMELWVSDSRHGFGS